MISFSSESNVVVFSESEATQTEPEVLVAEVAFQLGKEVQIFEFAKIHVFLNVASTVYSILYINFSERELDLEFVSLFDVIFGFPFCNFELCFVIDDGTRGRLGFQLEGFQGISLVHIVITQNFVEVSLR